MTDADFCEYSTSARPFPERPRSPHQDRAKTTYRCVLCTLRLSVYFCIGIAVETICRAATQSCRWVAVSVTSDRGHQEILVESGAKISIQRQDNAA